MGLTTGLTAVNLTDSFQNRKIIFFLFQKSKYTLGKDWKKQQQPHRPELAELGWQNGKLNWHVRGAAVYPHWYTINLFLFVFFLHKPLCTMSGLRVRCATWGSLDRIWSGARAFVWFHFFREICPDSFLPNAALRSSEAVSLNLNVSCLPAGAVPLQGCCHPNPLECHRGAALRRDVGRRWSRSVSSMSRPS